MRKTREAKQYRVQNTTYIDYDKAISRLTPAHYMAMCGVLEHSAETFHERHFSHPIQGVGLIFFFERVFFLFSFFLSFFFSFFLSSFFLFFWRVDILVKFANL